MAMDVQAAVLSLMASDRKIEAIKLVREQTGVGLREAKEYCDALDAGQMPAPLRGMPSLADRVRMYVQAGDADSALRMLCYETGMTPDEASRFVQALNP